MADLPTLQLWVIEAELALHKLMTGTKAVKVDQGLHAITYSEADADDLRQYIAWLYGQIALLSGDKSYRRQPLLVRF